MRNISFIKASAFDVENEVTVPCVVLKKKNDSNQDVFVGFVPGLANIKVVENTQEVCMKNLFAKAKDQLKSIVKNGEAMPFFPTEQEVKQDFENVCDIKFIRISKKLQ